MSSVNGDKKKHASRNIFQKEAFACPQRKAKLYYLNPGILMSIQPIYLPAKINTMLSHFKISVW